MHCGELHPCVFAQNIGTPQKPSSTAARPAVAPGSDAKATQEQKRNLEDELDYVTKNLLDNFDNPNVSACSCLRSVDYSVF